jgi:hypothetical protein
MKAVQQGVRNERGSSNADLANEIAKKSIKTKSSERQMYSAAKAYG